MKVCEWTSILLFIQVALDLTEEEKLQFRNMEDEESRLVVLPPNLCVFENAFVCLPT